MSRFLRSASAQYWTMQLFLCLVLGGTLVLAAVVRHRITQRDIRLEKAAEFGPFLVQRPVRWAERYTQDGVIFEELSARGRPRRRLEVWTAFTPVFLSPLEFVARGDDARLQDTAHLIARADAETLRGATTPIVVGGWNGVLIAQDRLERPSRAAASMETVRTYVAGALLPSGELLLARLDGEGIDDAGAEYVLGRMGRTLRLLKQEMPATGKPLALDDWTTLTVPARFATFANREEVRVSRLTIGTDAERPWLAVDVVPCVMPGRAGGGGAAEVLPSLMTMRDPLFRGGAVEKVDDETWRLRRNEARHPGAVFLHDLGDGRGVLADVRWTSSGDAEQDEARVREAWRQILEGLEGAETSMPAAMVDRGRDVGRHLPADAAGLLERGYPVERWQWYHETVPRQSETRVRYGQDERRIYGSWEGAHAPPLAEGAGPEQGWFWLGRDWNGYRCLVARDNAAVLSQLTRMVRGRMRTAVVSKREAVGEREVSIDGSFVPGSVFMLVLGALPAEPVVLTTDWLVNPTGGASAWPLTLVMTPVVGKSTPRATTGPAMGRAWDVRINGRSFASRWQLDGEGRVESVRFGGNVRLRRMAEGEGREAEKAEKAEKGAGRRE